MKIYFVRHGKTQGNIEQRYNSVDDDKIVAEGIKDLEEKKIIYQNLQFDYIYCSTLNRCLESFVILFPDKKVDEYREDIVEIDFGDWAGRPYQEVMNEYFAQGYTIDDFVDPVNGESYESLFQRVGKFLEDVSNKFKDDENILVLTHGMVIAAIMKKHYLQDHSFFHLAPRNGLGYIVDTKTKEVEKIKF